MKSYFDRLVEVATDNGYELVYDDEMQQPYCLYEAGKHYPTYQFSADWEVENFFCL